MTPPDNGPGASGVTPPAPAEGAAPTAEEWAALREQVAELKAERDAARAAPPPSTVTPAPSPEQIAAERQQEPFYCPGCGRTYGYQRECEGTAQAPHPPIEVVSTDELGNDPSGHTAAPASSG